MKKSLLIVSLLCGFIPAAMAQTFPQFPAFDPFLNSTGTNGGSTYAPTSGMGQQTNAMGQIWDFIDSNGTAANAVTNTGYSISYLGLPGFSGNEVLDRNVAGPGGRYFFNTNGGFPAAGPGTNYYYSIVIQASNITSLSSTGNGAYFIGFGTSTTYGNQTTQPTQAGGALWIKQVNTTNFELGVSGTINESTSAGTPVYSSTALYTNQAYLVVVDDEYSGGAVHLWVNPATNTFGVLNANQPAATATAAGGTLGTLSDVEIFDLSATNANALYISDFRTGTNWSWATGGPDIGYPLLASTNCSTGILNLSVTAMNNGTPNTYNWQLNGTNLANGPSISGSGATVSGATNATLTISGMDTSSVQLDSGSYTVVVSNTWGAVTSSVSSVTAYATPVITAQPSPTNLLLYVGQSNTISLTALGFALSYDWYSNSSPFPAITGTSFTIPNVQSASSIYCIVSNSIGTATSSIVSVVVEPLPTDPYPLQVYNDHAIAFLPLDEGPDNTAGDDGTTAYDYISGDNGFYTNAVLALPGYGTGLASEYGYSPATDTSTSAGFGPNFGYNGASANSYVAQIPNINFASAGAGGPSFSVEAWANGQNEGQVSGACIVGKGYVGSGEQFTMDYTSGWRFYVREAGGTVVQAQTANVVDGNWHHLVGVLDTVHSNVTMYVDGLAQTNVAYLPSTGILSSTNPVTIGSSQGSLGSPFTNNFNGTIQDVAIYNYALTAAQVSNHFNVAGIGPTILSLPSTNVNEGATFTYAGTVTGSPSLSYSWYDLNTQQVLSTNATLVISNISYATYNGTTIQLTVTNIYGHTSAQMNLTVLTGPPASVTVTPPSIAAYVGSALSTFTVTAQGTAPFSYQWSTNGVNVAATNSVYSGASLPPGSYTIGCAVTNSYGPSSPAVTTATLVLAPLPTDSYGLTVLSNGPIAFWRLDETNGSTTAYDYVGNHNATYNNAINGQPGFSPIHDPSETATVFGSNAVSPSEALEIDNSAGGVPLIDFAAQGVNAEFSVELWVQEPAGESGDIISKGYVNHTQFAFDNAGTGNSFRFIIHYANATIQTASTGSVLADGNWHYLVGVCDEAGGALHFYADGKLAASSTIAAGSGLYPLDNSTYPVLLAAQMASGGTGFTAGITNASLSQVALYNYAMTSNQVAADYAAATQLPPLSPFSITSVSNVIGASVTLNWLSVSNYTYQVQAAAALAGGTNAWTNLGSPIVATGTNTSYTDSSTNATGLAGYYRVIGY